MVLPLKPRLLHFLLEYLTPSFEELVCLWTVCSENSINILISPSAKCIGAPFSFRNSKIAELITVYMFQCAFKHHNNTCPPCLNIQLQCNEVHNYTYILSKTSLRLGDLLNRLTTFFYFLRASIRIEFRKVL